MEIFIPILFVVIFLTVVFVSYYFSKKSILIRKLKKHPVNDLTLIKKAQLTKVVGTVELVGDSLTAPLSNRLCAYYEVEVQKKVSRGKNSHWETIIREEKTNKFIINVKQHKVFINTKKIKKYIVTDKKFNAGTFNNATEPLENYLKEHGHKSTGSLGFNKTLRFYERILEPNEKIAVLGIGKWVDTKNQKMPLNYQRIFLINPLEDGYIYLSDEPKTFA